MKKLSLLPLIPSLLAMGACESSDGGSSGATPGPNVNVGCTQITTDCSAPMELKNADIKGGKALTARTCYVVNEDLVLSAGTLAAEEGVVLQFATGKSLKVQSGGQLKLNGTCPAPVRLTSRDPVASWKGVQMDDSQGSDNTWTYGVIDRAGSDKWTGALDSDGAVYLSGSTTLKMDHVTISNSKAQGLIAYDKVDFTFTDGTFEGNVTPAYLHPQVADRIPAGVTLTNNTNPYFRVVFGNNDAVEGAHTWAAHAFRIEDRFFVKGDLTIAPGASLAFAQGKSMIVEAGATLTAKGNAASPVAFKGAANTRGFWQGIHVKSGGIGTPATIGATFDHCVISDAGGANWTGGAESKASVFMNDTSASVITNTTFSNSAYYGLSANEKARLPGFAANKFSGNARVMHLHPDRVGELAGTSVFTGNDEDTVRVVFGNNDKVSVAATWRDAGVPYTVMDRFFVDAALTIDAGVTVLFPQDQGVIVSKDTGSLAVNGTAAKPVKLAGQNAIATGYWQGIHIMSNSANNKLSHTTIANAGVRQWTGAAESDAAIYVDNDTQITLDNVTLGPGGGYGVYLEGLGSMLGCSAVTFPGLVKGPIWKAQPGPGGLLAACP